MTAHELGNDRPQPRLISRRRFALGVAGALTTGGVLVAQQDQESDVDRASSTATPSQNGRDTTNVTSPTAEPGTSVDADTWLKLLSPSGDEFRAALETIDTKWHPRAIAPLLEAARIERRNDRRFAILRVLERQTGFPASGRLDSWYIKIVWANDYDPIADYHKFKSAIYSRIDPRFAEYFDQAATATIRLDEVRWGGVVRDGIPPLKDPEMVSASHAGASYLNDSDVVFGVAIGGESKCYPKRILAWHEMVKDTVGGTSICGVYCTLCGSMIVYRTLFGGQHYELGTSGFLYRSNKLMYDHATKSMWSTLKGEPVIGTLVGAEVDGRPLKLEREAVVTTTWGAWRAQHPDTKVLTLRTGHRRDYGEGVAYRNYFATDRLMFAVPKTDDRLLNKDEVVALRFDDQPDTTLAISTDFLANRPVYEDAVGDRRFVILTDQAGANRVYETVDGGFDSWNGSDTALSHDGRSWQLTEAGLVSGDDVLARLPSHRAFWFGWQSAYPDTRLVR